MTSVSSDARQRASDKLARLAGYGLDLVGFWRASTEVLAAAVPHNFAPCWFTLDPASLLVTSHFDEGVPELPSQWMIHKYYQDDVNNLADVAAPSEGSPRCTRPPAGTRPAARAGISTWPWVATRS
jgi:hypothetical protein